MYLFPFMYKEFLQNEELNISKGGQGIPWVAQWLGLCALTATQGLGFHPDWGTKTLQAKKKF